MSTNFRSLTANARTLGEIFYSGSISVTKGEEVSFPLSEWFSFRVTEDCKVSMNASPFVEVAQGDSFIIYKRIDLDIEDGNRKGVYIFDRDLILSMAYSQELTQDIIIENDIYSNNYNTVIVEADQTPVAHIAVSTQEPKVGETILIDGRSSYPVSPATISSYAWTINGKDVSTSSYFNYKTTNAGAIDITLVITDSDGRKANTRYSLLVKENTTISSSATFSTTKWGWYSGANLNVWTNLNALTPPTKNPKTMYSAKVSISGSFSMKVAMNSCYNFNPMEIYWRIILNSGEIVLQGTTKPPPVCYSDFWNTTFSGEKQITDCRTLDSETYTFEIYQKGNPSIPVDEATAEIKDLNINYNWVGYDKPTC